MQNLLPLYLTNIFDSLNISCISFAAFSLILSSIDLENNMMRDVEISAAADDALDCFIFANDEGCRAK